MFTEVSKHRADYGVVPVENSTEGVVTHTEVVPTIGQEPDYAAAIAALG